MTATHAACCASCVRALRFHEIRWWDATHGTLFHAARSIAVVVGTAKRDADATTIRFYCTDHDYGLERRSA